MQRQTFINELHALADRFNRKASDELIRRYYQELKHLTDDEFLAAARIIYRTDTFWPAPARFEEAIGMDAKTRAENAWEEALEDARNGKALPWSEYEPAHATALRKIGGIPALGRANEDRLPFIRREFISAYQARANQSNAPALEKPDTPVLPGVTL